MRLLVTLFGSAVVVVRGAGLVAIVGAVLAGGREDMDDRAANGVVGVEAAQEQRDGNGCRMGNDVHGGVATGMLLTGGLYLLGLAVIPFAPETKGQALPE